MIDEKGSEDTGGKCLLIAGRVNKEYSFSISELLAMEMVEFRDMLHACGSGEPKGRIDRCRGVLLSDVLNKVDVTITEHNDTKKMYLRMASDDGYSTVFSWQEIFNTQIGEGVIVILERDGKKVYEQGCVDLMSAKDFLSGPRYVKRLATIEILMVE